MGWNILRRALVVSILFSGFSINCLNADTGPETPRRYIGNPGDSYSAPFLQARQNQSVEKAWSIDVSQIVNRSDFTFWLERWSSNEGYRKIQSSMERYFDFRKPVDTILRGSGVPWELIAIPVVESNWRTDAISPSGAAGPWQFIESSARGRNLIIDAWRDERRDIWLSTEAAMSDLSFYHRLFSDWLLAIASYNAGPTRIRHILDKNELHTFQELDDANLLPRETENYIPQVAAVAYIISHSGRAGLPVRWDSPTDWIRIPMDRSIHLLNMIDDTGIKRELIEKAHKELHHPVTPPPSRTYYLKIPEEDVETVKHWLELQTEEGAPERFWRYTVRSGDTLSEIAENSGISLSALLSYNSHVQSGLLRIGERLYLPGNEMKPEGAEDDSLPDWKGRYRVLPGDTLWSIARTYGIRPEKLAEANHRPLTGVLPAGSVLHVPDEKEEL